MFKGIFQLFSKTKGFSKFSYKIEDSSIDFYCDHEQFQMIKRGDADDYITAQYVALQMLVEQGDAEPIPNGFIVPHDIIAALDDDVTKLLVLPERWKGQAEIDIRGITSSPSFRIILSVESPSKRMTAQYQNTGSIISFGENVHFLLTRPMYMAFRAFNDYASTAKCESDNLFLLYQLQQAKKAGANLKLSHFDKLAIHVPDQIAIEAELDSSGNLILTPAMGQNTDHDHLQRVLGQLQQENARTLKVGNEIILFNEKTAKAVKEIISHRVIPKNQVEQFLKSPSAFIDASLVELDVGFSFRVKGATRFKHAYFGETDESGIDWLSDRYQSSKIQPISEIISEVTTQEDLQQLIQLINDAQVTNADTVDFNNKTYDISNEQEVQKVIDKLTKKINNTFDDDIEQEPTTEQSNEETIDHGPIVIDIALNDEELESPSQVVKEALSDVLYSEELDWSNHKRKPLSHQVTGVKWILGLEEMARKKELVNGSLLADDMGLGKTYMALSAIDHYYRICENLVKPVVRHSSLPH